ncbi:RNA-directed DNA polymerase, eukaryota, reverse transcriptase zinc-binding domain protein [Tanacetum coccineum]|uniref:RNA-directed DNA polymerase, eukaryota, reverse transcriptase zinc-binding domain protein n=1 Tax=Tanacetum coccineum TaxID=301880 RepID=A0ABQ4Z4N4_9ASTR
MFNVGDYGPARVQRHQSTSRQSRVAGVAHMEYSGITGSTTVTVLSKENTVQRHRVLLAARKLKSLGKVEMEISHRKMPFGVLLSKFSMGMMLKDSFSRLFALENNQDCKVKECWCLNDNVWGGNLSWRLAPRGRAISDLNALLSVTRSFSLDDSPNYTWLWRADASGIFKVKSLTTCLQNSILSGCELGKHHVWNMLVPRKVNICVWRASLNRFPSPVNLISQGVPLSSSLYPFCDNEIKDIEHSLIKCSKVLLVWRKIWS